MRCAGTAGPPRRRPNPIAIRFPNPDPDPKAEPNPTANQLPLQSVTLNRAAKTGGLRVPAGARGARGFMARAVPSARPPPNDRISLD